jgi:hypothetical protein
LPTEITVKASGTMSGNFLDTCLDYSLTIYVMQRTASVAGFADPTQLKCRDDWRKSVVTQINREV